MTNKNEYHIIEMKNATTGFTEYCVFNGEEKIISYKFLVFAQIYVANKKNNNHLVSGSVKDSKQTITENIAQDNHLESDLQSVETDDIFVCDKNQENDYSLDESKSKPKKSWSKKV